MPPTPPPMARSPECQEALAAPLTTFHLFSKLPAELRLKIWNLSLPPPRLVPIRCGAKCISFSSHSRTPRPSQSGCTSYAPIPVNLSVCHESRSEALKSYRLSFGITRNPGQIYFNAENDILYFGARDGYMASEAQFLTVMSLCNQDELASVRSLAINDSLFWVDSVYQSMSAASLTVEVIKQIRARMPRLEELTFVPRDENPIYSDTAYLLEPAIGQTRMARQIQASIKTVRDMHPDWQPPKWRIMMLSAVPETVVLDRSVMGFDSPRIWGVDRGLLRRFREGLELKAA